MKPEIDRDLLFRGSHLTQATANPSLITTDPVLGACINVIHGKSQGAYSRLQKASDTSLEDQGQNRAVVAHFASTILAAAAFFSWWYNDTRNRLTQFRPGTPIPNDHEMALRRNFLGRLQPLAPTELAKMRDAKAVDHIESVVIVATNHPEYVPPDDLTELQNHAQLCRTAYNNVVEEGLDDDPIFHELTGARAYIQQVLVGSRMVLGGILHLEGSPITVDEFILKVQKQTGTNTTDTDTTTQIPTTGTADGSLPQ